MIETGVFSASQNVPRIRRLRTGGAAAVLIVAEDIENPFPSRLAPHPGRAPLGSPPGRLGDDHTPKVNRLGRLPPSVAARLPAQRSDVPHGTPEPEEGQVLVVHRVVETVERLDPAVLGVEDLGVRGKLLAVAVGDDLDVLLRLADGEPGDRHPLPGGLEVEPPGPDLQGDVGRQVGPLLASDRSCALSDFVWRRVLPESVNVQSTKALR